MASLLFELMETLQATTTIAAAPYYGAPEGPLLDDMGA